MIKITKGEKPELLTNNADAWRDELLGYISRSEKPPQSLKNKYNQPSIKESLREESNSKCMYCESNIKHITPEHIEHIKPKAKYPELTYEWDNLGLACPVCNMNKSDLYDAACTFINPYHESPDEFLMAVGPLIYARPGQPRGEITEKVLQLNRTELVEKRVERISAIRNLVEKYENQQSDLLKKIILNEIQIEIGKDKEYSLIANALIKIIGVEVAA